jgi:hypothetical protein
MATILKEAVSWAEICQTYPSEWILLGNPLIKNLHIQSGIVLFHHADKAEVARHAPTLTQDFTTFTIRFTGEPKLNSARKWLRNIRLD